MRNQIRSEIRTVNYKLFDDRQQLREYELNAFTGENNEEMVGVYCQGGELELPVSDIPSFVRALQEFL